MKEYKIPDTPLTKVEEIQSIYATPFTRASFARRGVSTSFLSELMQLMSFKKQEIASLIDVSFKTMDRHIKAEKPFTGLQSDRILELAELHQKGNQVFGNNQKFLKWLNSQLPAFNNTTPRQWLDTHQGIETVMNELGRIEHGIFA